MRKSLTSALIYILGNAIGLFLATLLLPGFKISLTAFIFAVLIFSAIEIPLKPLILKLTRKNLPALEGGIALVATFLGLFITSTLLGGMQIGGLSNWLLATLLVWIGAMIGSAYLSRTIFRKPASKE